MANYITTDTELTSVADEIRSKGRTNSPLVYPTGYVAAIRNLKEAADLFPVGSYYASEDGTDDPAVITGIGTWRKISPANTVNELMNVSGLDDFVTIGTLYVWKRTA